MYKSKLKVGATYKSYREVCKILGIEPKKSGKSRQLHLQELARYFEHTTPTNGYSWTITKIYDEPLEKIDKRGGNNNYYGDIIKNLLMVALTQSAEKDESCTFTDTYCKVEVTLNGLAYDCGMTGDIKLDGFHNAHIISKTESITTTKVNEILSSVAGYTRSLVRDNIKRMAKKELISSYDKVRYIKTKNNTSQYKLDDLYHRETDYDEDVLIDNAEDSIYIMLKCKNYADVSSKGLLKEFNAEVKKKLIEKIPDYEYHYSKYRIYFSYDVLKNTVDEFKMDKFELKVLLNRMVNNRVIMNAANRQMKASQKDENSHYGSIHKIKSDTKYTQNYINLLSKYQLYAINNDKVATYKVNNLEVFCVVEFDKCFGKSA